MPTYERPKLLQTRYVGKDFDTYFDDMVQRAKVEFGSTWNNFAGSDPGVFFMDLMAYALGTLSFYLDRQTNEVYLDTALVRENVARIARQLGYKPGRATASTTDLTVTLGTSHAFAVTLPEGFKFQTPSGLVFSTASSTTWSASDTSAKTVTVNQVEGKQATFVSDGTANQVFNLPGLEDSQFLVGESLVVTVGGDLWSEKELLLLDLTDQYEVNYDASPPTIRFGDGLTAGNVPASGDEIRVAYKLSFGTTGNLNSGVLSTANGGTTSTPLIISGTVISMTAVQSGKATGGSPPETIERIRVNAPRYYASRAVAVTKSDYEALAEAFSDPQYGRPAMVSAVNVRSSSDDTELTRLLGVIETTYETTLTDVEADLADIQKLLDTLALDVTRSGTYATSASSASTEAGSAVSSVSGSRTLIAGYQSDASVNLTEISDLCDDILDESPSANVISFTNAIKSKVTTLQGLVTSTETAASGLSSAKSLMETAQTSMTTLSTNLTTLNTDLGTTQASLTTSKTDAQGSITSGRGSLSTAEDAVQAHVNGLWSSACQANIVTVPVLTKDADGFYTAPPNGLMKRLEDYLAGIKDVTHSVKVIDGSASLVAATVTVSVKVQTNYVVSSVLSEIEENVRALLKDREYGDTLYKQSVYDLKDDVEGVLYLDVALGPTAKLDTGGNLVPEKGEVITIGTVTVTEI